jgi:hypothetical protein
MSLYMLPSLCIEDIRLQCWRNGYDSVQYKLRRTLRSRVLSDVHLTRLTSRERYPGSSPTTIHSHPPQ